MTHIEQGQNAPGFTTTDQNGQTQSLKDLRGKHVVLAFVPGNNGQQDKSELQGFNAVLKQLHDAGAEVLAVAHTDEQTQKNLSKSAGAKYSVLLDKNGDIANNYGCAKKGHALRNTFLIGPDGRVKKVYESVFPNSHPNEVLNQIQQWTGAKDDAHAESDRSS